jgi:hypothetical protein
MKVEFAHRCVVVKKSNLTTAQINTHATELPRISSRPTAIQFETRGSRRLPVDFQAENVQNNAESRGGIGWID